MQAWAQKCRICAPLDLPQIGCSPGSELTQWMKMHAFCRFFSQPASQPFQIALHFGKHQNAFPIKTPSASMDPSQGNTILCKAVQFTWHRMSVPPHNTLWNQWLHHSSPPAITSYSRHIHSKWISQDPVSKCRAWIIRCSHCYSMGVGHFTSLHIMMSFHIPSSTSPTSLSQAFMINMAMEIELCAYIDLLGG